MGYNLSSKAHSSGVSGVLSEFRVFCTHFTREKYIDTLQPIVNMRLVSVKQSNPFTMNYEFPQ